MKKLKNCISLSIAIISVIIMFISVYNNLIQKFADIGISKQNQLNQALMPCNNFVEALTIYGNNFYERGILDKEMELYKLLEYNSALNSYSLDSVVGKEMQLYTGNITGTGRIPKKGVMKVDIDLAINYNEFFYTFYHKLPDVAQISYTSKNKFINIYPWIPSNEFAFYSDLLKMEYYAAVRPKNNPYRKSYWTHPYLARAGSDVTVSLSSPIYNRDIFMGAVSISIKTNWLSNMLKSEYEGYIVDETYTVIASNQKISPNRKIPMLNDVLNSSKDFLKKLNRIEINSIHKVDKYYIYKTHLKETPWMMIIMVPVYSVITKALLLTLPVCIIGILLIISINEIEHRKKVEEEMRNYALTDSLTGLKNRRFLDSVMDVDTKYNIYSKLPLTGIMIDLDHFKYINDTWGHPVGDEVLKRCAEKIKKVIRSTDILVRMGGEEFMILLPQTDSDSAFEIAEIIRTELEQDRHPVAGKYTASFGIAGKAEGESVNSFYRRIDEALYYAKEEGRNCIILYDQHHKKILEQE